MLHYTLSDYENIPLEIKIKQLSQVSVVRSILDGCLTRTAMLTVGERNGIKTNETSSGKIMQLTQLIGVIRV